MLKKTLKIFFRIVFSHTMITFAMLIFQAFILFATIAWLGKYSSFVLGGLSLLGGICLVYLINKDEVPEFKLAWVIPICIFPIFGAMLFLFVDQNFGSRKLKVELGKRIKQSEEFLQTQSEVSEELNKLPPREKNFFDYVQTHGGYPTCKGGEVTYFPSGEAKWADMLTELKNAKEFIFLEYFILDKGEMWDSILDILKEKAAQGVDVRVMYDGMCSILLLPYSYPKKLQKYGIKAKMFSPIIPLLSTHQNNRDHRKILVIDGKVAYNGGVNLADEYINKTSHYGHWKDVAIKVKGTAVDSFTIMFLQMWSTSEWAKDAEYAQFIHKYTKEELDKLPKDGLILPYGDGPHDREYVAQKVYMDVLNTASNYVHIMTPYFIVDNEMLNAIKYAALRGVKVRLILPHIPDKKVAFSIARNYYPTLLAAGIEVYEYTPGFVHAKVFSSDNTKAIVGTINLDYRSLYHHFECATYLYGERMTKAIEQDFQNTLTQCQKVDLDYYKKIPALERLMGCIFNLVGPLM